MSSAPVTWWEPTGRCVLGLRRFTFSKGGGGCANDGHDALVMIDERPQGMVRSNGVEHWDWVARPADFPGDPRWPAACSCGYVFQPDDEWQVWTDHLYERPGVPGAVCRGELPAGACFDAWWMPWKGSDGRSLIIRCPRDDGAPSDISDDWHVDGPASNCTIPDDRAQLVHHCWVRTGDPTHPETLTAGKDGPTCSAGAGSIQTGHWHGFLRDGQLVP
jgi:hypothetical protein